MTNQKRERQVPLSQWPHFPLPLYRWNLPSGKTVSVQVTRIIALVDHSWKIGRAVLGIGQQLLSLAPLSQLEVT